MMDLINEAHIGILPNMEAELKDKGLAYYTVKSYSYILILHNAIPFTEPFVGSWFHRFVYAVTVLFTS